MGGQKGKDMFDKFGEFDSCEELNRAAVAQRQEGDENALVEIAKENGIDVMEAEDFMDGAMDEFVTPLMAAVGKLKIEIEAFKISGVLMDWVEELQEECMNSEWLARAVRKKGKGLDGYIAALADNGFKNKSVVTKEIVKKCSGELKRIVGSHPFYIGVPNKATRRKIIKQYYLGEGETNESL